MFLRKDGNANPPAFDSDSFAQVLFENKTGRVRLTWFQCQTYCFKINFLKLLPIQSSMGNTVMVLFLKSRNNFNILSELCSFAFLLGYLTHF